MITSKSDLAASFASGDRILGVKALLFTCSYVTLAIQAWFWVVAEWGALLERHSEWWYRKGAFGGAGHRGEV